MTRTTRGTVSILIAILLMGIVFYSSSMPYHDQSLVSKIQQLLSFQPFSDVLSKIHFTYADKVISIPSLGYAQFIEFFIRKGAHFLVYYFIGYRWTRGLKVHLKNPRWSLMIAIFITVLYAITDEFHQGMTPGRTPLFQDMVLDSLGGIFGSVVGFLKK
jgi:vanZ family protein